MKHDGRNLNSLEGNFVTAWTDPGTDTEATQEEDNCATSGQGVRHAWQGQSRATE